MVFVSVVSMAHSGAYGLGDAGLVWALGGVWGAGGDDGGLDPVSGQVHGVLVGSESFLGVGS